MQFASVCDEVVAGNGSFDASRMFPKVGDRDRVKADRQSNI